MEAKDLKGLPKATPLLILADFRFVSDRGDVFVEIDGKDVAIDPRLVKQILPRPVQEGDNARLIGLEPASTVRVLSVNNGWAWCYDKNGEYHGGHYSIRVSDLELVK